MAARSSNLAIYLNDHWAAAAAGRRVARHLAVKNRQTPWASELSVIAREIKDDRRSLGAIRSTLGIDGGAWKGALAIGLELLAELKMKLTGNAALSRVNELETLLGGVSAKRGLWVSLQSCVSTHDQLAEFDLSALEHRASRQLERLRVVHAEAAALAFAGPGEPDLAERGN